MSRTSIRSLRCSTALLALALLTPLVVTARPAAAQPAPLDAFLCYVAKTKGFHKVADVHLVDQFNDLHYSVTEARELCTPAADICNCQGECPSASIGDPVTHLKQYKIEADRHGPKPFLPTGLSVTTCLGTVTLDTYDDDKLLVPALKSLQSPPQPDLKSSGVDHFNCYDVKLADNGKLDKNLRVSLSDQFTSRSKTFDVVTVEHLCVPVDKNGEGVKRRNDALLCYEIKAAKKQPKFQKVKKVYSTDQFGSLVQDLTSEDDVCLPATIAGTPAPMCAGASCEGGGDCTSQFCNTDVGVCAPVCADPSSTCVCGGDCTSGFCNDSGGSPGFCAPVCAGTDTTCVCGGDCTSSHCDDSAGSPGHCAPNCADPSTTCVCGGDCTSGFCDDSGGSPGHCAPVCAGLDTTCVCGGDCTSGFCDDGGGSPGHCAPVFDGGKCVCGGDCISGFCDDSLGLPGVCGGVF